MKKLIIKSQPSEKQLFRYQPYGINWWRKRIEGPGGNIYFGRNGYKGPYTQAQMMESMRECFRGCKA